MGRYEEALGYVDRSIELEPGNADAWNNRGMILQGYGRYPEVLENFHRAIQLQPGFNEAHSNYATANLILGHFSSGWDHYRYRLKKHADDGRFLHAPLPADLHRRKVYLTQDQGIGDELFFLRYARQLKQRGAWVGYRPGQKIRPLLQRCDAIDALIDEPTLPNDDADDIVMSVGDLAFALGVNDDDPLPASIVLAPLPGQIDAMQQYLSSLGPAPYLGVTWRGGTIMRSRLYKEIPLQALGQGLAGIKATLISLQRCPKDGETQQLAQSLGAPLHDASALNDDLEAMLALLGLLDEYVGVSNTNIHLMAALGRHARVLVPAPAEWRWMASGDESPWFPGFHVYRQSLHRQWDDALARLRKDLAGIYRFRSLG